MIRKSISVKNKSNEDITLDLLYDEGTREAPTILILHGFKGFKDWGFFPEISRSLSLSGYVTLCMNFSRNGIGMDPHRLTEIGKFADNTLSHEMDDVAAVLENIRNGNIGKRIINPDLIGIFGHSRGGSVALLSALENQDIIQAVVTWSAPGDLYRYSPEQIELWNKQGFIEVENPQTKQVMRLNKTYLDDLNKNKKRFSLTERITEMEIPVLFVHGASDTSVPTTDSELLYENCGSDFKRVEIIEEAGHTFGIRHPFEVRNPEYETAYDLTEYWFDTYVKI